MLTELARLDREEGCFGLRNRKVLDEKDDVAVFLVLNEVR